jgi:hypothetical protein
MSTVLVEGAGSMSKSVTAVAMFWLALVKAGRCASPPPPLTTGGGGRFLGLSLGGGEIHC